MTKGELKARVASVIAALRVDAFSADDNHERVNCIFDHVKNEWLKEIDEESIVYAMTYDEIAQQVAMDVQHQYLHGYKP